MNLHISELRDTEARVGYFTHSHPQFPNLCLPLYRLSVTQIILCLTNVIQKRYRSLGSPVRYKTINGSYFQLYEPLIYTQCFPGILKNKTFQKKPRAKKREGTTHL